MNNLVARGSALLARDSNSNNGMSTTVIDLLITLLVLVFVLLCLTAAIFTLRRIRQRQAIARQQLPLYNEKRSSHHRRLTISTTPGQGSSIYVYDEKSSLKSPTTPTSPVPEIRITFPDEQDESGRPKSGRVVVVRVGENGVGLEPLHDDEQLPAYEKESKARFQSIDIERIGGLKEKPTWS
jgi:hypothetical protein